MFSFSGISTDAVSGAVAVTGFERAVIVPHGGRDVVASRFGDDSGALAKSDKGLEASKNQVWLCADVKGEALGYAVCGEEMVLPA